MRILAIGTPNARMTSELKASLVKGEMAYGAQLFEQGKLVEGYAKSAGAGVYMFLECRDLDEAHALVAKYPMTEAGIIDYTYVEVKGLPSIGKSLTERNLPTPAWWPASP